MEIDVQVPDKGVCVDTRAIDIDIELSEIEEKKKKDGKKRRKKNRIQG